MLHIHHANRWETLVDGLLRLVAQHHDVFEPIHVVVPSSAVQRGLTLAMADRQGVCANVRYGYLAQWLWQQIAQVVPGVAAQSPFSGNLMGWRAYGAFGDPAFVERHPRLRSYLANADAVMRYELAMRVGATLEQYVTYRPTWLAAWASGRSAGLPAVSDAALQDEAWQAELWRLVLGESRASAVHPGEAFLDALERDRAENLPAVAHLFALPAMPPLYLRWLKSLGRCMDLHVHVLNPCSEYWLEVVEPRRLSHLRAHGRDEGHEVGNHILASWARQTQSHIDLLIEAAGDDVEDTAEFVATGRDTMLGCLQDRILRMEDISPSSIRPAGTDRSIEVHVCHALTRELEVLHDHLLSLLADDGSLRPCDILVVTPDLERAAPLVEAVFGTAQAERRIPFSITGRGRTTVDRPAQALLALLTLASSRMLATDLFAALQLDLVARRHGLDADALALVHEWLGEAGFCWGMDESHRAALGLPMTARHTLVDALDRLFLGYALPDAVQAPFGDHLPAGAAEGSEAEVLGNLSSFAQRLVDLRQQAAVDRTPEQWRAVLQECITSFLQASEDDVDDLRALRADLHEVVSTMRRGGIEGAMPLAVFRKALEERLDDPARGGVPMGSVTFSTMSSLRGLPFRVVCVVGLNDGAWPSGGRPAEFDLMALQPQRGDRQRRDDERNIFLDLLLSARDSVYLSHTGRSIRDNAPLPPSVLVSELLDVLVPAIAESSSDANALIDARARLVVEHPLQAFSPLNFQVDGDPRRRSFDGETCEALRRSLALRGVGSVAVEAGDAEDEDAVEDGVMPPFFTAPLPEPGPEWRELRLEQLIEFFRNPCRYLLRRRVGVELLHAEQELQDEEPFVADFPGLSRLADRLLPALLDDPRVDLEGLARAGRELPEGAVGELTLSRELGALRSFAEQVRVATTDPCLPPLPVRLALDLDGEAWTVSAGFADLRASGLVRWRYDKLRPTDVMQAWLTHLVLCASRPDADHCTRWHLADGCWSMRAPETPLALLGDLVHLYREGLKEPLRFFPKSAWAYIDGGQNLRAASQKWLPSQDPGIGEGRDPAYQLALRGLPAPLGPEFEALAVRVFGPAREHLERNT